MTQGAGVMDQWNPEGVLGRWDGGGWRMAQEGRNICIHVTDSSCRADTKKFAKQLYSN